MAAAILAGVSNRDRGSRLIWRLVLWTCLLVMVAYLRLRVWPPETEIPPLNATINDFVLPLIVVIGIAFGAGIGLGRAWAVWMSGQGEP